MMYIDEMIALNKMTRSKGIPFSGMVELTPRCNLHCGFCYVCDRNKPYAEPPEKSSEEWLDLIAQAAEMGLLMLSFTGGDPFMREDFEEIYCKAYDMGLRLGIFTNAILIGKKQRDWLKKRMPDMISISLYGASEKAYRTVCGGNSNFRRLKDSLDGLREDGLPYELKALAMLPLAGDYEAMGRLVAEYRCESKFGAFLSPGRDDPERYMIDWRVPPDRIPGLFCDFYKAQKPLTIPVKESTGKPVRGRFFCVAGKNSFCVTWDGRMLGCPTLYCFATRPFEDGFACAWDNLKAMIGNAEPCLECEDCAESGDCSACPAIRLKETGSVASCNLYLHEMARCMSVTNQLMEVLV